MSAFEGHGRLKALNIRIGEHKFIDAFAILGTNGTLRVSYSVSSNSLFDQLDPHVRIGHSGSNDRV